MKTQKNLGPTFLQTDFFTARGKVTASCFQQPLSASVLRQPEYRTLFFTCVKTPLFPLAFGKIPFLTSLRQNSFLFYLAFSSHVRIWGKVRRIIPRLLFCCWFKWGSARVHQFYAFGHDQSTVAQRAETIADENSLTSCV